MNVPLVDIPLPPQPPADSEARNVIEKFAAYVAKNGPGFEEISRQKNADNPKFAFLFGGEHHQYYQFRLMFEIQQLKGNFTNPNQPPFMPPPHIAIPPVQQQQPSQAFDIPDARAQIDLMRSQIKDSENNLQAQHDVLQKQKEMKVEEAVKNSEEKKIMSLLEQVGLNIDAFNQILGHLQTSCSKDTISNSKKWIFDYCTTDRHREIILTYLLFRVKSPTSTDAFRLHILYLINDWAHYCQRKKMDSIRQMVSRYVPQLYAYTAMSPTIDQSTTDKLDKLVGVWEGHKYFDDHCYKQLRNPSAIIATGKNAEYAEHARYSQEIDKEILTTLNGYKKQHQEFERHMIGQIAALEVKISAEDARLAVEKRKQEEKARQEQQRQQYEQQQYHDQRRSRFDQSNNFFSRG